MNYVLPLIPALPLVAFVVTLFLGKWWLKDSAHWIPIVAMAASFVLSVAAFLAIRGEEHAIVVELWRWIPVGDFQVPIAFQLDQLSAVMLLVVTGVGTLIFIYSKGYMHHDPGYYRFFAYLSLFAFSMLMLVLGSNYLLLYLGWELVGLCSYYLIGFYYHKPSAASAGKKAFLTNRVGDFGFGIGVMLIFVTFGTLDYIEVFEKVEHHVASEGVLLAIGLLLFLGAMGKSAQFPLHVWLPDAMEGPTPVSALIHAATMVTAGVYMVARSSVIFASAPTAMLVVGAVGAFTAIFAASIGLAQNDIKRVMAYSTVSQLGYMFMALGIGAWVAAIFHLVTHAFFKALLFLGSGSVIHSLSGEQDMRKMGGLAKKIPFTYWTLMAGALALSGIVPFAGFWSKDEILGMNFKGGGYVIWAVGLIAAFITAFYTFRLIFMTFWGESRMDPEVEKHVHESPWSMVVPLMVLGVLSVFGGFLGFPPENGVFHKFLEPVFHQANEILHVEHHYFGMLDFVLMVVSVVVALSGVFFAYLFYVKRPDELPQKAGAVSQPLYKAILNKWYIDEFYNATIIRLTVDGSRWLWRVVDAGVIDGAVNGVGRLWDIAGRVVSPFQTGRVQNYAVVMFIGLFVIVTAVIVF
ncbi:MAG: NADH-quinone oxidoreductase subunit L [Actinobacteria bacterium]|nr:NADH-quinone oxidoreductase subunit L [Actinomycetota bacterium]